ncbi:receptor-like protein kinase HERK 1 [Phragmites australis]|uniref:receptor-like protein kinase HERK 1 n=1 Tax=Phragmites australis TaxID=29695 RepID=UPI002D7995BB|nr:receptor-like protein kinase HERK 1 [Phragmites australis]
MSMAPVLDTLVQLVVVSVLFAAACAFTPADNYLILCGTSASATVDGRTFVGDAHLPALVLTAPQSAEANASASSVTGSDEPALYQYARVFMAPSSYTFAIKEPGRHFVRLHFFPFRYQSDDLAADARFRVSVQGVVFVDGYTPKNGTAVVREFSVNVPGDTLVIAFTPTGKVAFVNAIEVVSHPDDLIADTAQTVSSLGQYTGLSTQALETVHRINMGIPKITPSNDSLWRTWLPDQSFLLDSTLAEHKKVRPSTLHRMVGLATTETAPDQVYATATELNTSLAANTLNVQFNVTWRFDTPPGSAYLLRLHFCDIVSKAANGLAFNVYVGGWRVLPDYQISSDTSGELAVPIYRDFVLSAKDATGAITVSIGPSTLGNVDPDGLLNGLEIMRVVGSTGASGAGAPPHGSKKITTGIVVGSAVAGVTVVTALGFIALRTLRRKKPAKQPSSTWAAFSASALASRSRTHSFGKSDSGSRRNTVTLGQGAGAGYRFPFAVLQQATSGFNEGMVIGEGGFGKVYKGMLGDDTRVAVKRGNRRSQQGLNEFRTEIELLSRLRHRHLVSLIGYCDERREMILVYEYMARGTLRSHLYGSELPPLSWKQRLEVCIGAARGLHYLHTGSAKAIIHRDVKSANILLDDSFMAKVADFGLSKTGPELDKTHVSTAVKGSFGYLDPEYFRRQMLTEKSDVYSFGVVLLEVLCARPVIDPTLPREKVNLAEWATQRLKSGELDSIVDQRIAGTIQPDSLKKFADTAEKCLAEYGVERPTMGDVLWCLEFALQLQEASPDSSGTDNMRLVPAVTSQFQRSQSIASDGTDATMSANLGDLDGMSMRRVFSKMVKSEEGR